MSDHAASSQEKASLLSNVLAIIGLIILVIIIVWGLVHVAELGGGWFSSLFGKSGPSITITAPNDAPSGAPVAVSWDYAPSSAGGFSFLYQCQDGFQFAVINTTTNTASTIPCGTAFAVTPNSSTDKSIQVLPLLTGTTSVSVPFSVIFTPTSGTQVEGSATIMIHLGSATASATAQENPAPAATTATTKPAVTAPVRTYTPADLSVQIVSQYVDQYGNGTVTFNIENTGGSTSGGYYFTAQLPTASVAPYVSSAQTPLTPGSYIVDTLHFTQAESGTFTVAVHANDRNQFNNYASQWIQSPVSYPASGYNYNYNSNNYNPYPIYQMYPYTY